MEENQTPAEQAAPQTVAANPATQKQLPNATAVLVLGIISIPTCFCFGIIGLALGIIALVLSGKSKKLFETSPDLYTESSYNNLKAGRVCAIIGTILSALYLVYIICGLLFGTAVFSFGSFLNALSNM